MESWEPQETKQGVEMRELAKIRKLASKGPPLVPPGSATVKLQLDEVKGISLLMLISI
jgi:hypothetical protein